MKLINARHEEWGEDVPLFCTENEITFTRFAWCRRMPIYSKRLGVPVRPYDLRHTFSIMYLRNGGNVFSLQRTLGHANLTMTKRYVAITQGDLNQQHEVASPLKVLIPEKHRVRKV